jgi:uncharacterized protein YdcH (DUF465 family)
MHIDNNQFMKLQERVNALDHQLNEVKMERNRLQQELQNF